MKRKVDFIFIGLLGTLMVNTLVQSKLTGTELSINNYGGGIIWIIITVLRFTNHRYRRYGLAILLFLGTVNIANLGLGNISFSVGFGNLDPIGIDPIIFLLLIIYYFINKNDIQKAFKTMFFSSDEENQIEHQKLTDFYFKKFKNCSNTELETILESFNEYPLAAQSAIEELCKMKNIKRI
ncbi:hypothetical protein [Pedobacter nyackensis]|uniref:Uncharacterized protein n=1 Tax=Pedobacter nyackensis TaxID=475255 RepID=A0A1W2AKK9_9SPHI|nr:hypothetical protein [Pedobacter nyackensis]SMC60788.1 hypothetical protein SAMN04488101_101666 [Pedobacter nyackensis]